jgi:hypothetical protein
MNERGQILSTEICVSDQTIKIQLPGQGIGCSNSINPDNNMPFGSVTVN